MTRQATRLLAALAAAPERRQAAMIALVKHGRIDLRPHTNFLDLQAADAIAAIAGGSLALCRASDEAVLIGAGFHRLRAIQEPDGTHSFSVLQK